MVLSIMTTERFLKLLSICKGDFTWELRSNKEIIGKRDGKFYDSVTAVFYYVSGGRYCSLWRSRRVAKRLDNMTEELRTTIIRASCNILISKDDREMRKALERILLCQ